MLVNQRPYIRQLITRVDAHLLKRHFLLFPVNTLRNRNELPFFAPIGFSVTNVSGFRAPAPMVTHLDRSFVSEINVHNNRFNCDGVTGTKRSISARYDLSLYVYLRCHNDNRICAPPLLSRRAHDLSFRRVP